MKIRLFAVILFVAVLSVVASAAAREASPGATNGRPAPPGQPIPANDIPGLDAQSPETAAPQRLALDWAGQSSGRVRAVAVEGDTAYVGIGWQLVVMDISSPAEPAVMAQLGVGGGPEAIAVAGGYAYLVFGTDTLSVIDVSEPARPRQVGTCRLPGSAVAHDVAVEGDTAYVAYGGGGLRVIDVSNRTAPVQVGAQGTQAITVAVNGGYAYVAAWYDGLRVFSSAENVVEIGAYEPPTWSLGVSITGATAYMADGPNGLQVIDVSDPRAPARLGACDTPADAQAVAATGSYAFVAAGSAGLRVIDVSDPTAPAEVGHVDKPGAACFRWRRGDRSASAI